MEATENIRESYTLANPIFIEGNGSIFSIVKNSYPCSALFALASIANDATYLLTSVICADEFSTPHIPIHAIGCISPEGGHKIFWSIFTFVNKSDEEVAFSFENSINFNFEFDVRIE